MSGNKFWAAIGAAGLIGYIGWNLLTSNVFASKSELDAVVERMRAERSQHFVSKSELNPVIERLEAKIDKMNDQLTDIKVELAELRKASKDQRMAYGGNE